MRPLFTPDTYAWARALQGRHVVYLLRWDGQPYVGSTKDLRVRLIEWRGKRAGLRGKQVWLDVLGEYPDLPARLAAEASFISPHYLGHNLTHHGRSGRRKGSTMGEAQRAAIARSKRGYVTPESTKAKMRASHLKRKGLLT